MSTTSITIASHAQAAKRLLHELEQQSDAARSALDRDEGDEFLSAVSARDKILAELEHVVNALVQERSSLDKQGPSSAEAKRLFAEVAQVAAAALESQESLHEHVRIGRDRAGAALGRAPAHQPSSKGYGGTNASPRRTLSVTG